MQTERRAFDYVRHANCALRLQLGIALGLLFSTTANAAYPTRVLTAVEEDKTLPDIHLGLSFDRDAEKAKITREWIQDEGGTRSALDVKELNYSETTQRLLLNLRVGLYRDLEFHMVVPIVLGNKSEITFADGVQGRSTIFGSQNANDPNFAHRYPITEVPSSRERSGLGDMVFGLAWSPFVDHKDEAYPTLTLKGDIVAPTGKTWDPIDQAALPEGSGGGVGRGQTVFDLSIGLSKRMGTTTPTFDPYMVFGSKIPVATPSQRGRGLQPPASGSFLVGTEVVVFEDDPTFQRYAIDFSFKVRFIGIGRTYSQLTDYLPNFDQVRVPKNRADPTIPADIVTYNDYANPSNYANNIDGASCGLIDNVPCGEFTRVDEHMEMMGAIALRIQPAKYVQVNVGIGLGFTTDHLLTTEKVGTDTDPANAENLQCDGAPCVGRVNASNSLGQDERSSYYDPRYDAPGRRLRVEEITNFTFFVSGAATF